MYALDSNCWSVAGAVVAADGSAALRAFRARFEACGMPASNGPHLFGAVVAESRFTREATDLPLKTGPRDIALAIPLAGQLTIVTTGGSIVAQQGEVAAIAEQGDVSCRWHANSAGMILLIGRDHLHARCFALHREPRRLGTFMHVFERLDWNAGFGDALLTILSGLSARSGMEDEQAARVGSDVVDAFIGELRLMHRSTQFSTVGPVQRALQALDAHSEVATPENLARSAGITLPNLRRNVRDCTGTTLARLLQDVHLDRARSWLSSDRESRSIEQIARVCGFERSESFVRAYRRRFGETPTQTRVDRFAPK